MLNGVRLTFCAFLSRKNCWYSDSLENLGKLVNANLYDNFAYHTVLLNEFSVDGFGRRQFNQTTGLASSEAGGGMQHMTGSNASSVYSTKSLRLMYHRSASVKGARARRGSFQGSNVFKSIRTKKRLQKSLSATSL